jgi:hypothetical protein
MIIRLPGFLIPNVSYCRRGSMIGRRGERTGRKRLDWTSIKNAKRHSLARGSQASGA